MPQDDENDLPLHDEAKARSRWREGETIVDKGGDGSSGPASEVDDAGSGDSGGGAGESPLGGALRGPPD